MVRSGVLPRKSADRRVSLRQGRTISDMSTRSRDRSRPSHGLSGCLLLTTEHVLIGVRVSVGVACGYFHTTQAMQERNPTFILCGGERVQSPLTGIVKTPARLSANRTVT
jgi:hypothetical protein